MQHAFSWKTEWSCFQYINESTEDTWEHPWALSPCDFIALHSPLPGQWEMLTVGLSRSSQKQAWCGVTWLRADAALSSREQEDALTHAFLMAGCCRALMKRVTWKSPMQRWSPARQTLWLASLMRIRSPQWVKKSQMKLLATSRYYY